MRCGILIRPAPKGRGSPQLATKTNASPHVCHDTALTGAQATLPLSPPTLSSPAKGGRSPLHPPPERASLATQQSVCACLASCRSAGSPGLCALCLTPGPAAFACTQNSPLAVCAQRHSRRLRPRRVWGRPFLRHALQLHQQCTTPFPPSSSTDCIVRPSTRDTDGWRPLLPCHRHRSAAPRTTHYKRLPRPRRCRRERQ